MTNVDLSKYENSWYRPGSFLKRTLWYVCNAVFFKTDLPYPQLLKRMLLICFGAKLGKNVVIKPNVSIKFAWLLETGNNVWIGENAWIDNLAYVKVGDNICLSQGAYLLTGNHDYKREAFDLIIKPIIIEDGAWVGANAIVCPGVILKTHSVLTVGSVATKHTAPYTIYTGNPAVPVKKRHMTAA